MDFWIASSSGISVSSVISYPKSVAKSSYKCFPWFWYMYKQKFIYLQAVLCLCCVLKLWKNNRVSREPCCERTVLLENKRRQNKKGQTFVRMLTFFKVFLWIWISCLLHKKAIIFSQHPNKRLDLLILLGL